MAKRTPLQKGIESFLLVPDENGKVMGESYEDWVCHIRRAHLELGRGAYVIEDGCGYCPLAWESEDSVKRYPYRFTFAMQNQDIQILLKVYDMEKYGVFIFNSHHPIRPPDVCYLELLDPLAINN